MRRKPTGELPFEDLPLLVRFRDLTDPTSIESVDPFELARSYGAGVTLKRATVEITDDPITTGITKNLPWLASSNLAPALFPPSPRFRQQEDVPQVEELNYNDFRITSP